MSALFGIAAGSAIAAALLIVGAVFAVVVIHDEFQNHVDRMLKNALTYKEKSND